MPGRPDIHQVIDDRGHNRDKRVKSQNSWPIDMLTKRDVYVVDQFGAMKTGRRLVTIMEIQFMPRLAMALSTNGAIRDISGLKEIGSFTSFSVPIILLIT
jgi:hypothetical protein